MTTNDVADRVAELVEPLLDGTRHELYDVVLAGATLRVLVAGGADLDELARLTREISALLDEVDPIPDRYTLEVSSPGLERTLRTPRHFAGAIGEKVKVKTTSAAEGGDRRADGVLIAADDDGFVVDTGTGERRLSYGDIDKARTVFEWGSEKPVSPSKKGKVAKK